MSILSELIKTPPVGLATAIPATDSMEPAPLLGTDARNRSKNSNCSSSNPRNRCIEPPSDEPRRLWFITHDDGQIISHSCTPPATLSDVRVRYPEALSIEPEEEEE